MADAAHQLCVSLSSGTITSISNEGITMASPDLSSNASTVGVLSPHDNSGESSHIGQQLGVLGEDVKELGRMGKDAIVEKIGAVKDAAGHAVAHGRDKVVEYRDAVADRTREQPIKSLLIAAGVGALVGIVLGRR
jgi:ElaB/YqjD/DUF883 family membrane-anchored ribosome-binding protein